MDSVYREKLQRLQERVRSASRAPMKPSTPVRSDYRNLPPSQIYAADMLYDITPRGGPRMDHGNVELERYNKPNNNGRSNNNSGMMRDHHDNNEGAQDGWKKYLPFIIIFAFVILGVGGYVGWTLYERNKNRGQTSAAPNGILIDGKPIGNLFNLPPPVVSPPPLTGTSQPPPQSVVVDSVRYSPPPPPRQSVTPPQTIPPPRQSVTPPPPRQSITTPLASDQKNQVPLIQPIINPSNDQVPLIQPINPSNDQVDKKQFTTNNQNTEETQQEEEEEESVFRDNQGVNYQVSKDDPNLVVFEESQEDFE
jgi:hypothetical protein